MKNILAAIDYSESAVDVLNTAADLAKAFNGSLCILHVDDSDSAFYGPPPDDEDGLDTVTQENPLLVDSVDRIRSWLFRNDIHATVWMINGMTVENILRAAERLKADLIVIGSLPYGKFFHLLFGDVIESLLKRAPCPVVVVPHPVNSETVHRLFDQTVEDAERSMTETIDYAPLQRKEETLW